MVSSDANRRIVQSDMTLLKIVEELNDRHEAGVTELANSLELPKSTVHKHLQSLETKDYVINNDGCYRLSIKFLCLGGRVRSNSPLAMSAKSRVDELTDKIDLLVAFSMKNFDHGVFVFRKNYQYGLEKAVPVGRRFTLYENASGKAMLAELPDEEIYEILDRQGVTKKTKNTISNEDELFTEIEEIRKQGYAFNFAEDHEGINAIGAAVSHDDIDRIGALSIAGPASQLTEARLEQEYAELLLTKVNEIEIQLTYQ